MLNYKVIPCASDLPYPPVTVCARQPKYGRLMLENMGGAASEMSAVTLYLYNHFITSMEYKDITYLFRKIAVVEMHHLEILGQLAFLSGEEPRLWCEQDYEKAYWSPDYNKYPYQLKELILNAKQGELQAIAQYEKQIMMIEDEHITANLSRIILDEKIHIEIFDQMLNEYCD